MPTVRDRVLAPINRARTIIARLGFQRYTVTVRTRTWAGGAPGLPVGSTPSHSDLVITPSPRVRTLSAKEIAGSGGTYQEGDFIVTGITPQFTLQGGGGYSPAQLRPTVSAPNQDVCYILTGDEGPIECFLHEERVANPFEYTLILGRVRAGVRG